MKMTGLDHITVNVKDLDRSKAFYGDVLGLKEAGPDGGPYAYVL